jgi:uncharacterized membrane protein
MHRQFKFLLGALVTGNVILGGGESLLHSMHLGIIPDQVAEARSTGGRSGGGSFSAPSRSAPSRSGSSQRRTTPVQPRSYPQNRDRYYDRNYDRGPVFVPVPIPQSRPYNSYPSTGGSYVAPASIGGGFPWMLVLLGGGGIVLLIWLVLKLTHAQRLSAATGQSQELINDTVTVSKLQVALLASARTIQAELSDLSLKVDTSTREGLLELLQGVLLSLLRAPEYWSHVQASSQTVRSRDEAKRLFNQLAIAERSKFSAETLVNVGGQKRQQEVAKPDADETAAYIVVTLLIGTADDKPLYGKIQTINDLKTVLEQLAATPADYLMVLEVLWSPQDAADSLTYDELLTEYTDMIQM